MNAPQRWPRQTSRPPISVFSRLLIEELGRAAALGCSAASRVLNKLIQGDDLKLAIRHQLDEVVTTQQLAEEMGLNRAHVRRLIGRARSLNKIQPVNVARGNQPETWYRSEAVGVLTEVRRRRKA